MKDVFKQYTIGHFINQPQNPTEFEVTLFNSMPEPDVEDPHKHTFYEIIWVESGATRQSIDYVSYDVNPQSLFFISPGQLHQFEEWQHVTGGSIMFTEDFLLVDRQDKGKLFELSFLDNLYGNPSLQLSEKDFKEVLHTIQLLMNEKGRKDYSLSIIRSLLNVLLDQIQRCVDLERGKPFSSKYIVLFKQFKCLLDRSFTQNLTVSQYAEHLNITQHHLNDVVKQITGKTAGEAIRARSVLEAKRLLAYTDNTVTEIADHLGYEDPSYFARIFKKDTGTTPAEFKTKISEKYPRS
jgi:AraC family transcriptional regulator, transcriptional activator of pobA